MLLGNVLINNTKVTYYNAAVNYYDILRFRSVSTWLLRGSIIERFKSNATYFTIPRYMFVSYKYLFAFVYAEPKRVDLAFPNKAIDVYRSADFY